MDNQRLTFYCYGMCPKCYSSFLKIKKRAGFERIMIGLTGKRKYWCCDCFYVFRAVDRRRSPRDIESMGLNFLFFMQSGHPDSGRPRKDLRPLAASAAGIQDSRGRTATPNAGNFISTSSFSN